MGQAAVLPDPLDETSGSVIATDDLLAQLAGEEIDRLLAESEADLPPPVEPPPAAATTPAVEAHAEALAADVAVLAKQVEETIQPQEASPPPPIEAAVAAPESEPSLERIPKEPADPVAPAGEETVVAVPQTVPSPRLPLYLRPLEWLSAPLDAFPEMVREALGKVAIITLMNALAVLLYVVIFRR